MNNFHIYILQSADAIRHNEHIYKVGRTDLGLNKNGTLIRFKNYKKRCCIAQNILLDWRFRVV